jgi:hypothetical protein
LTQILFWPLDDRSGPDLRPGNAILKAPIHLFWQNMDFRQQWNMRRRLAAKRRESFDFRKTGRKTGSNVAPGIGPLPAAGN